MSCGSCDLLISESASLCSDFRVAWSATPNQLLLATCLTWAQLVHAGSNPGGAWDAQELSDMEQTSAGDHPCHAWEEKPPSRAAGEEGRPAALLGQETNDTDLGSGGFLEGG